MEKTYDDPERAVRAGIISGVMKRRKDALENLPEAEKGRIAYEIYCRVQKEQLKRNRFLLTPGLNEMSFKSAPYRLFNVLTGAACGGSYGDLIFSILVASDEVLTENSGLAKGD